MKSMILVLLTLILLSPTYTQQEKVTDDITVFKIKTYSTDRQDIEVDVDAKIEDNLITVVITRDGNEQVIEIPFSDNASDEIIKTSKVVVRAILTDGDYEVHAYSHDTKACSYSQAKKGKDFIFQHDSRPHKTHDQTWLGVHIQTLTDQLKAYFKVKNHGGILVSGVEEDSPAEKARLKAGDVIYKVNDESIESTNDLSRYIRGRESGEEIKIYITRNGRKKTLTTTLNTREPEVSFTWFDTKEKFDLPQMKMFKQGFMFDHHDLKKEIEQLREEMEELKEKLEEFNGS